MDTVALNDFKAMIESLPDTPLPSRLFNSDVDEWGNPVIKPPVLRMSHVNYLIPPVCTCYNLIGSAELIEDFLYLRRTTDLERGDVLTLIGLVEPCCRSHFMASLLVRQRVNDANIKAIY